MSSTGADAYRRLHAAVRELKRENLLRYLGSFTASEWRRTNGDYTAPSSLYPWNASLLAREALLAPSNSNGKKRPATDTEIHRLSILLDDLEDPLLNGPVTQTALREFALRAAYQQFPYGPSSIFGQIARVRPMFDRDFPADRFKLLSRDSLERVLGGPVDIFVDSAPFFGAAAVVNGGLFDEAWLQGPHFEAVRQRIDIGSLLSVFRTTWTAPFSATRLKAEGSTSKDPVFRPFDYNPLRARPFVTLSDQSHVAPQAWFAQMRISHTAIYHLGHDYFSTDKDRFQWANDLGLAQEDYILSQLRQLVPRAEVFGEIEYATTNGTVRTVDAIVVLPDVIVLVESKSLRARLDSTNSFQSYQERLSRDLDKALGKQLPRTVDAISSGRLQDLKHVHVDRPIVAFVVTPEPLHQVNTAAVRAALPASPVPTAVISLGELEHLVSISLKNDDGTIFLASTAPDANGNLDVNAVLKSHLTHARTANPLLDASFASGRWSESENEAAPESRNDA